MNLVKSPYKTFGKKRQNLEVGKPSVDHIKTDQWGFVIASLASLRLLIGAKGDVSHMSLPRG